MCLGVPGRVVELLPEGLTPMGIVDFAGVRKQVCLAYVPEVQPGDYVVVHVGFAITQIDEASAQATLRTFHEMGLLEEEFGAAGGAEAPACPNPATWTEPAP